jgi:hypothetical protein
MINSSNTHRPTWTPTYISEKEARAIRDFGMIVGVDAAWKFTSADTKEEWLEVTNHWDKSMVLPKAWFRILEFAGHASSPGLFRYTHEGKRVLNLLADIDKWEEENAKDRAELARLMTKFGLGKGEESDR